MGTTSAGQPVHLSDGLEDGSAAARTAELFERHGATVLGLCRVLLRNKHEAEDAVQQTFLAAYRSLLNGSEPRYPAAWLATIARNECWSQVQHRMREPTIEPEPELTLPDPVVIAAARADLDELYRAIGDLPLMQRQALLLREFSGLSYEELADVLCVSEPAVESLLVRARRRLRLRLRPVYRSVGCVVPLVGIRQWLWRLMDGLPTSDVGGSELAKMASVPLVTKLAAGAAAVVVTGGTVAAFGTHAGNDHVAVAPAEPPTAPMSHRTGSPAQTARAETHPVLWAGRTPRPSRNAVQRPSVAADPSTNSADETSPSVQVPARQPAPKPVGEPRAPAPTAPRQAGLPSTPDPSGATGSGASGAGSVPVPADPGPAGGTDDGTDDGTAQPVDTGDPANAAGGGASTGESASDDDGSSASGEADSRDNGGSDDSSIDDDKSGDGGGGGDDHHDAES